MSGGIAYRYPVRIGYVSGDYLRVIVQEYVPMAQATAFRASSLKAVLKQHSAESLAEEGRSFYFGGVEKFQSGRAMRDGSPEIVYEMSLVDEDGEKIGRVKIARLSIAEQLENAGVVGADAEEWFGPVRIVQSGRTYRMEPTD